MTATEHPRQWIRQRTTRSSPSSGASPDDVLRDLFKRGKYPDVILPMCVIRRMDAVLEPTKAQVLATKKMLDEARITEQRAARDCKGQTSPTGRTI